MSIHADDKFDAKRTIELLHQRRTAQACYCATFFCNQFHPT